MISRIFQRPASTAASAATKRLVETFRETAKQAPVIIKRQVLDSNQLQRLSLTLNRPQLYQDADVHNSRAPANGTPVPPGYHLVYFTPAALPEELGRDGTDISYSPGAPFTRRMWAGGEIKWEKGNPLRIGDDATETTQLISADPKVTRAGEDMIVVCVEKTFENAKGLALIDKRDWVFRKTLSEPVPSQNGFVSIDPNNGLLPSSTSPQKSRDFMQTAVSLFRFSALTFNGHMIHYSRPWCRDVEGHREIVVHGPLNLINMLDFWRDTQEDEYMLPKSIRYRATAPFYVGENYRALMEQDGGTTSIKLWGHDGQGDVKLGMLGDILV